MKKSIRILGVNKLTDFKWLNLYDAEFSTGDGPTQHWTFASRKPPQPGNQPLIADAVVIIPLFKDGRKRKLVTIKEFRIPLGDYEYAFPAGLFDHNETAEAVAKRELKEETGLNLKKSCMSVPQVFLPRGCQTSRRSMLSANAPEKSAPTATKGPRTFLSKSWIWKG